MRKLAFLFVCLILAIPCQARIITVDDDGPADFNNIQAGIDDANGGDIVIVASGTYTGEGNRDIDFLGKEITVRSTNPDDPSVVESTIIDSRVTGPRVYRAFIFLSGEDANSVLSGFTIIGYHVNPGGAIYCRQSGPTIKNCIITGRSTLSGGGIYCDYSSPKLTNCIFSGNQANRGGAMLNKSSNPTLINCMFIENLSEEWGGGMYNWFSNPTLTNCTFIGNSARFSAGGMYNYESSLILTNCTFIGNYAEFVGAMYSRHSRPMLTNCIFSGNSAIFGPGGVRNYKSNTSFTNCVFSGNSSKYMAGGMYDSMSSSSLSNCTFAKNSAGMKIYAGSLTLTNSILWDNAGNQGKEIYLDLYTDPNGVNYPSIATIQYTDVKGGPAAVYVETGCTLNWRLGNVNVDPCFVEPGYWDANDVWVEGDYHLLEGSPCIDGGDPNYVAGPNETDLDGKPRVVDGDNDGNSVVDIGAYEYRPPTPAELVAGLLEGVGGLELPRGIENGLEAKLNAALRALEDENENNDAAAVNALEAFINAVEAQRGKKIPEAEADALIAAAQEIIALLSAE